MKKIFKGIIFILILCIFIYSGFQLFSILSMRKEAGDAYKDLDGYVQLKPTETNIDEQEEVEETEKKPFVRQLEVDFESLMATNSDFVAWLYLPEDNIINYPVVQGEDNAYYLDHLFDGKKNANGTLFLDYRNAGDFSSDNSIIYGHTMQSKAMFHNLRAYKKQEYYEAHPYFLMGLPDTEYRLEVFAAYSTSATSDAYVLDFNHETGIVTYADGTTKMSYEYDDSIPTFDVWYKNVMEQNLLNTNVEVTEEDRIVTFSCCDYVFNNARFVVHCKIVDLKD